MTELLLEICTQILNYFPKSQNRLEVDVEDDGNHKLLLVIVADLEPEEAFETLQAFDDNWWLHNIDRAQGRLSISLELR